MASCFSKLFVTMPIALAMACGPADSGETEADESTGVVDTTTTTSTSSTEATDSTSEEEESSSTSEETEETETGVECEDGLGIGQCPPNLTLLDATGATVNMSDYADKIIILNCSAMW